MYVPNYVPEPEQIPGNVTKEPYALRLQFIRKTLRRFLGSVAVIVALGLVVPKNLDFMPTTLALLVVLFCVLLLVMLSVLLLVMFCVLLLVLYS